MFDLAYLRPIPNLVISAPYDEHQLRNLMHTAVHGNDGLVVIRYPRVGVNSRSGTTHCACSLSGKGENSRRVTIAPSPSAPSANGRPVLLPKPRSRELAWPLRHGFPQAY